MKLRLLFASGLLLIGVGAQAQDSVYRRGNPVPQPGRIVGNDERTIKFEMSMGAGQPSATVTWARGDVERVVFGIGAEEKALLQAGPKADPVRVAAYWQFKGSLLNLPDSNAGAFGLIHAANLIRSSDAATRRDSLAIFERLEHDD